MKQILKTLAIVTTLILVGCSSLDPATRYRNEHKDKSFDYVMKNNTSFTVASHKEDTKTLSKKLRSVKKTNSEYSKTARILKKNEVLREQIEELKKNNK